MRKQGHRAFECQHRSHITDEALAARGEVPGDGGCSLGRREGRCLTGSLYHRSGLSPGRPLCSAAGTLPGGTKPGRDTHLHTLPPFLKPRREDAGLLSGTAGVLEKSRVFI